MKKYPHISPPQWAKKFLHWFCKEELLEMIEGDIEEEFQDMALARGKWRAKIFYTLSVFSFLRPFAIRHFQLNPQHSMGIFTNYSKVAFRSLKKDKLNTSISALGLFIAMCCAMLIYLVLDFELSYDAFHHKADRIYRITMESRRETQDVRLLPQVGPPVGPAIKSFYPEIENAVRFRYTPTTIMATDDGLKHFYEENIFFADPSIFNIFSYPLAQGDESTALSEVNNVVLSAEMAKKYFGKQDPMGKILLFDNEMPLKVSGVLQPIPANTHFPFDFLRPFEAFKVPFGYPVTLDDWRWGSFHTYVLLKNDVDAKALENKLPEFAATHFEVDLLANIKYLLQPLQEIYFNEPRHDAIASGNMNYVIILGSIGILLLLLASFNFTNIFTAKSLKRSCETGLRKTLGSSQYGLWLRYLMEPIFIAMAVTIVGMMVLPLLIQWINQYFGYSLFWEDQLWLQLAPPFLGLAFLLGLTAGIYPAFVMSSFQPLSMLGGMFKRSRSGILLRKLLVTLQFTITSFLLIGSFIISSQIDYMQNKDLGFDKERLMVLRMPGDILNTHFNTLKSVMSNNASVENISVGGGRMDGDTGNVPILAEGWDEPINLPINGVKENFFETIGVEIVAGREFNEAYPSDSATGIIINEVAAKTFGWTAEEALEKRMTIGDIMQGKVVGVVKDFHFTSLHTQVQPLIMYNPRTLVQDIYLRVTPGDVPSLLSTLEADWKEVVPAVPFDYIFLDNHLQQLYQDDARFASMVKVFSLLTILIAILGLYGLIALVSEQRIKEIGIRKVLGASFRSLITTLSGSFMGLILIANLLSWPLVYLISEQWISNFAYRIPIGWTYFALALIITMLIAFCTLLYQTSKIAMLNPVKTLRYE